MGGFGFDLRGLVCHTLRGALGGMAFYKAFHTFLMVGGLIAGVAVKRRAILLAKTPPHTSPSGPAPPACLGGESRAWQLRQP